MIFPDFVEERPMGLFDSLHIAEDAIPHGACRRCRCANIDVVRVEIRYPGTVRLFECCVECRDWIMNKLDQAMMEAGV